jgi:hypothetical protein
MKPITIAAHVAIVIVSMLAGLIGRASYGFSCFYRKQPFGSACDEAEGMLTLLQFSLAAAAGLYAFWGAVIIVRLVVRRIRS